MLLAFPWALWIYLNYIKFTNLIFLSDFGRTVNRVLLGILITFSLIFKHRTNLFVLLIFIIILLLILLLMSSSLFLIFFLFLTFLLFFHLLQFFMSSWLLIMFVFDNNVFEEIFAIFKIAKAIINLIRTIWLILFAHSIVMYYKQWLWYTI